MGTSIKMLVGVAAALLTIAVFFMLAPMIGGSIDPISESLITQEAIATGTLTFSGTVADGNLVNFTYGGSKYTVEFNLGAVTSNPSYINANVAGGNNISTKAPGVFATAVNGNASLSAWITVTNSSNIATVTSDITGAAGNTIGTTETGANTAFGSTTLTGGVDGSDWDPDHNSAIPTGAGFWTDNASFITIVVIAIMAGLIIKEFTFEL